MRASCEVRNDLEAVAMTYQTFVELDSMIDRLLSANHEEQALDLLNEALVRLPRDRGDILLNRALLYCRLDRAADALVDIKTLLEMKVSTPLHWGLFDPIRSLPGFANVAGESKALIAEEQAHAKMQYRIFRPEGLDDSTPTPLVLVLHGDGGLANLDQFPQVWPAEPLTQRGIAVAYIQSSQLLFTNNHGWLPDYATAQRDVTAAYAAIRSEIPVDTNRVIVAGFSGGATTSMSLAFTHAIDVCGFIALSPAPWIPKGVDEASVQQAVARGLAGVILEGERLVPIEAETQMLKMFEAAGLRHQFVVNPGIGHEFPADLGDRLVQAVNFIPEEDQ